MKKVSIIFNPTAGKLQKSPELIDDLTKALQLCGIEVIPFATEAPDDGVRLAKDAVNNGSEIVIACGGDGTINEVAQSLIGTDTMLAVYPCGTANVFAREMGLSRNPQLIAKLIAERRFRSISVGSAIKTETDWQRYFLLMAGIGLDAQIVKGVDLKWKRLTGIGAYITSGLDFLAKLPLSPFSMNFNGHNYESTYAVVANAAHYAVCFTLAPGAKVDDDKLNVCIFNSYSRLAYLGYAFLSMMGLHINSSSVVYQETGEVIANSNHSTPVQLDGDWVGNLPMKFEIVPNALKVISP